MANWPTKKLGELVEFRNGVNFSRREEGNGIPILKVKDFVSLHYAPTSNLDELDPSKIRIPKPQFLEKGDIIIVRSNGNRELVGRSLIFNGPSDRITFSGFCIRARIIAELTFPEFIHYWLRCPMTRNKFTREGNGTGINNLSQEFLGSLDISLPPIELQKKIVAALSALDHKIELNRRMNETLEQMAQAIFKDWFVDFGPVRRKQEGASDPKAIMGGLVQDADRAAELAALFPKGFGDNGLPVSWRSFSLAELAAQAKRAVSPTATPDKLFEHYGLPAFDSGAEPSRDLGSTILSNKTVVPHASVLLSKLNPDISRVWVPNAKSDLTQISSTEFLVFEPLANNGRSFLETAFREPEFRAMMAGMVTGTSKSHQRVSPSALLTRDIAVGSEESFAAFERICSKMLDRRLAARTENRTLAETRDYLLPKLMSGEVWVREAEKLAELAI